MRRILLLLLMTAGPYLSAQTPSGNPELADDETYGYLYVHRSAHGGWPAYALSQDGIHFHDLLCGDSVFPAEQEARVHGSVPFVCRAQGGGFLLAARSGRSAIDLFRSDDLVDWTRSVSLEWPDDCQVGDPRIIWDKAHGSGGGYLLYFPLLDPDMAASESLFGMWADGNLSDWSAPADGYCIGTAEESLAEMRRIQELEGVFGPDKGSFLRISEAEYARLQAWSDAAEPAHLAPSVHNPVFPGLHADPEVLYSEQTGRYYIYPTTDGAFGWHNHDFKCFSSDDLVNWKDEGVILDLQDLDWGKEYAWAPCIIEKKEGEAYRYYFYFVANKSVGVAVADRPEGPYRDALGRPLLSQEEIGAPNIVIDPDVFRDPATGKYYLYWGNSYLWMAELADDMVSLVPGTMHELIPRARIGEYHYLEGTYVFERNGLYYFMWSENITRSARYCVRYLISDSPTAFVRNGQPARVEEQIILQQDPSLQIFGTGHNSVLNIPGTDDWYMVYHRFTRPEGIKMGLSGGYNREICIDPLYFNPDGTIIPVHPTL